jgi:pimeloyl-ACP methyl ester carboxylesterase/DNA-binding CsgD family transcriptional regulator
MLRAAMLNHEIRFCTARDGVRIAYGIAGQGPPLVMAPTFLNNLQFDPTVPGFKHWLEGLSRQNTLIWGDLRGGGMSDRDVPSMELDDWVGDLEAMVDDVGLERFALFGLSGGAATAVAYATRHRERVSHLALHGPVVRGLLRRRLTEEERGRFETYRRMIRYYWDLDTRHARDFFTGPTEFASPEVKAALDEFRRETITADMFLRVTDTSASMDVLDLLPLLDVPALVLHPNGDNRVSLKDSRSVTARIPGARLVVLDARNHVVQEDEPGWPVFLSEVWKFLGVDVEAEPNSSGSAPSPLSSREREVIALIAAGKTDAQIAEALCISVRTASRHVHNILTKLDAANRTEAVALAARLGAVSPST